MKKKKLAKLDDSYERGWSDGHLHAIEDIVGLLVVNAKSKDHSKCYPEDCWCRHSVTIINLIKGEL